MAHPRCLAYSPARALHRVLVSDLTGNPSLGRHASAYYLYPPRLFLSTSSRLLVPKHTPSPATPPTLRTQNVQTRTLTTTAPALQRIEAYKKRLANEKIPYQWVRIAAPPPDNSLSAPQRTAAVLRSLDPKQHTLVMVAPPPPHTADAAEDHAAICRIIDNAAADAAAKAAEEAGKEARRKAAGTKELEVSWSIAGHDMQHKLRRLREFLGKGLNVEVILAKKKGGRTATREEAENVLAQIREAVASIDGARESRKMDGDVGGVARLFFEGPSEKRKKKKKQQQQEPEQEQGKSQEEEPTAAA